VSGCAGAYRAGIKTLSSNRRRASIRTAVQRLIADAGRPGLNDSRSGADDCDNLRTVAIAASPQARSYSKAHYSVA
jgi:hypothetical protein